MTDKEFILEILWDEKPHSLNEILRRSFQQRGCGLTVHSRVADLRADGYTIVNSHDASESRGDASIYRLIKAQPESSPAGWESGGEASRSAVAVPPPKASSQPPPLQLVLEVPVTSREREAA